jgi:hypothetical protein
VGRRSNLAIAAIGLVGLLCGGRRVVACRRVSPWARNHRTGAHSGSSPPMQVTDLRDRRGPDLVERLRSDGTMPRSASAG